MPEPRSRRPARVVLVVAVVAAQATVALNAGSAARARAGRAAPLIEPRMRPDARDAPGAIDLRDVSFGQSELDFVLAMKAQQAWTPEDLAAGSSLCILLDRGGPTREVRRVCVAARGGRPVLRYQRVDRHG